MPPKALVLDATTGEVRRDNTDGDVRQALSNAQFGDDIMLKQGGGIGARGVENANLLYTHSEGNVLVTFMGELTNVKYLMMKGGLLNADDWQTSSAPLANPALVIHRLYTALGHTKTVAKLRGEFSFVLYDAITARVFAARDPSGKLELFQGSLENKSLYVSNFAPAGSVSHAEVPPGHFVAGGRRSCQPERFLPEQAELNVLKESAQCAAKAAMVGMQGIRPRSRIIRRFYNDPTAKAQKTAVEAALPTLTVVVEEVAPKVSKGKTKRGVRGGAGRRRRTADVPVLESTAEVTSGDERDELVVQAEKDELAAPAAVVERELLEAVLPSPTLDVAKAEQTIAALVRKFSSGNLQSLTDGAMLRSDSQTSLSSMKRVGSCSNMLKDEEADASDLTRVASLSKMTRVASLNQMTSV